MMSLCVNSFEQIYHVNKTVQNHHSYLHLIKVGHYGNHFRHFHAGAIWANAKEITASAEFISMNHVDICGSQTYYHIKDN